MFAYFNFNYDLMLIVIVICHFGLTDQIQHNQYDGMHKKHYDFVVVEIISGVSSEILIGFIWDSTRTADASLKFLHEFLYGVVPSFHLGLLQDFFKKISRSLIWDSSILLLSFPGVLMGFLEEFVQQFPKEFFQQFCKKFLQQFHLNFPQCISEILQEFLLGIKKKTEDITRYWRNLR